MASQTFQNDFAQRGTVKEVEEGSMLMPKFGEDGLIPCITTDVETGVILMFAYMNSEALTKTIQTREAHYWSRSRSELWKKANQADTSKKLLISGLIVIKTRSV